MTGAEGRRVWTLGAGLIQVLAQSKRFPESSKSHLEHPQVPFLHDLKHRGIADDPGVVWVFKYVMCFDDCLIRNCIEFSIE